MAAGACPHESIITRTWTAIDACGNSASANQTITVVDTTPPVVTSPGNQTVVPAECDFMVEFEEPTATDNCDPSPTVVCDPPSVTALVPGVHTISCMATDACGNTSAISTFTVTVLEPLQVIFKKPPLRDDNIRDDIETDDDVTNKFKAGQTVPVKIKIIDCNGVDVTTSIAPSVTVKIDVTERSDQGGTSSLVNDVPEDFNGVGDPESTMVLTGNHYQYNLKTKGFKPNTIADPILFFRIDVTVEFNSDPGLVVGREDALIESKKKKKRKKKKK